MTPTDKPCLEGCRENSYLRYGEGGVQYLSGPIRVVTGTIHAPNCPSAPKEPAARCECGADPKMALVGPGHALNCPKRPAPTPEPPKPSLEALKAEAEAMVKKAFADAREKEARREACPRCGMRIEPGMFHSPDGCYSVPTPEPPKPGIRYGGLMCPHGMVRGACAICRNPPASPKLEAESVDFEAAEANARWWVENLPRVDLSHKLGRAYLALRSELAAIKAQAEDATEYVLAVENKQLRSEVERLKPYEERWELARKVMPNAKIMSEVDAVMRLRAELAAERAAREKAEDERDELALLTVPSDADAEQVEVRLRIAEARVAELEEKLRVETNACRREEIRSDSHLSRVDELESLLASYADDSAAIAHTVVDSQQEVLDEGRAILAARSAKGGAND